MAVLILSILGLTSAIDCPSKAEDFTIAGASTVARLANAWMEAYAAFCDITNQIVVEAGGSTSGGARLCGTKETPVDIGGMSRPFNTGEASTEDGWNFDCERSLRSVIQVRI